MLGNRDGGGALDVNIQVVSNLPQLGISSLIAGRSVPIACCVSSDETI